MIRVEVDISVPTASYSRVMAVVSHFADALEASADPLGVIHRFTVEEDDA